MAAATRFTVRPHQRYPVLVATVLMLLLSACDGTSTEEPSIGGASSSAVTADLSDDALLAPSIPILDISIKPGTLEFTWDNVITATRTSLYAFDSISRDEWLVSDSIGSDETLFSLPTVTHQLPWHSRQYRIELCNADDCVSSLRVALTGRAIESIQTLAPAVSLTGEGFGQSVAINDNGTVAAIAEPLAGRIAIHVRNNTDWISYGSSDISEVVSSTRVLDIAMSTSGDTIAVYSNETDDSARVTSNAKPRLLILERLGESWFVTNELDISTFIIDSNANNDIDDAIAQDEINLYLSGDGERVLLSTPHALIQFSDNAGSWHANVLLEASPSQRLASSLGVSRSLDTIHIASIDDNGLAIRQLTIIANETHMTVPYSLPMIAATSDIQLASSHGGDKLIVFAWEAGQSVNQIPVAWQYQSRPQSVAVTGDTVVERRTLQLEVEHSLRLGPAPDNARLKLAASEDLSAITFAWQAIVDTVVDTVVDTAVDTAVDTVLDAALVSVFAETEANSSNRHWRNALELPQTAPAFAKNAFVDHLAMSHDGSVVMLSLPRENSATLVDALGSADINAGLILILQ